MRDNDKRLVDLLDSIIDDELRTWLKSASQSEKRDEIVRLLRATFQKDERSISLIYLVARELLRKGELGNALWFQQELLFMDMDSFSIAQLGMDIEIAMGRRPYLDEDMFHEEQEYSDVEEPRYDSYNDDDYSENY
jgi:hypothetical protein